jgi:hypothetical protein
MNLRTIGPLLLVCALCIGCAKKDLVRPQLDDQVLSLRYAVAWPDGVNGLADRYEAGLTRAEEISGEMPSYAEGYAAHKPEAHAVLEAAADAGTTAPVAQRLREHDVLAGYFDRSRKEATSRLAVATKQALDKDSCSCDVSTWGALNYALKRVRDEELERVRREFNEAQRLVDQYADELKRDTESSLRDHADSVSWASWFVNVEGVELALALERRTREAADVEKILARAIETEEAWMAAEGRRKAELREGEKRLAKLRDAQTRARESADRARALRKAAKTRIQGARDKFDAALRSLLTSLEG